MFLSWFVPQTDPGHKHCPKRSSKMMIALFCILAGFFGDPDGGVLRSTGDPTGGFVEGDPDGGIFG
ncbi:hypothetical protein HON36_02005 [Candidatus Parcubacteria bacterium]|jgi:hypothetical protein|nr:hypothetical protein [Candidatus Parcubacteria bacterium]MBT7228665.1 hypothetical protein [Candidatus Parcubacteria bacterium]